ncbi:sigma-70 family RNA polymerase sigma factor, partial [bacterium]|nr:sigma-70 family RNA polymerase sigma factor [bacterium]
TKNIISLDQKVYSTDGMETIADRIQSYDEKEYERNYENKKLIEYALGKLPQQERKSIYLYYIEGQTKKEISAELKVSQTQVARLIKRALVKMYNIIKEDNSSQGG